MIVSCKVSCYDRTAEEKGLPARDIWLKMSFNADDVSAVKQTVKDDFSIDEANCVIYLGGDVFTIDIPYDSMVDYLGYNLQKQQFLNKN